VYTTTTKTMRRNQTMTVQPRQLPILPPARREPKENDLWEKEENKRLSIHPSEMHTEIDVQEQEQEQEQQQQQQQQPEPTRVIVYISKPPNCIYSQDLIALANRLSVPVQVFDIDVVDPPHWLPGTPTLETQDGQVFCGDASFNWIMAASAQQKPIQQQQQQHLYPQQAQAQAPPLRTHHPAIIPRTLPTAADLAAEAKNEPYAFLGGAAAASAEAPKAATTAGATLADAQRETNRMENLLNNPQETRGPLNLDAIMAART
jgi:hypothetical protein